MKKRALSFLCALALFGLGWNALIAGPGALAQDTDAGDQTSTPAPITPAAGSPTPSSATPQSIFPQSTGTVSRSGESAASESSPLGPSMSAGLGYGPIRPGDIVEVRFFQAPEYDVRMPVSAAGEIAIPYAGVFRIQGMTSIEAAKAIVHLFEERQILRDPHVIVTAQQFGYSVTVVGEVHNPGVYRLAGRHRLIDILTEAGGVTDRAGHIIQVYAPDSMENPQHLLWDPTLQRNSDAGLVLKAGQTVMVSRCGVVYVGGNVTRPGAFPLCDSSHTTLSEVIALAQGIKPSSWPQRTLLLRTAANGTRVVEKVRLDDVLKGKGIDPTVQSDDIVFVPPSSLKSASKVAITAAIGFATQAYLYFR